jgi:hypothetical protein
MKTCVVFNITVKKIKLKHPNLTSQMLPECRSLPLSREPAQNGQICSLR